MTTRAEDRFRETARRLLGEDPDIVRTDAAVRDPEFALAARLAREELARKIDQELGPFDPRHLATLRDVPRERFVSPSDVAASVDDRPLPLDQSGTATISAPHAYLLSFRLVALSAGDTLVELGSGTGYGAALGAEIVGPNGGVTTFEIDPSLAERATLNLAGYPTVRVFQRDAVASPDAWPARGPRKVVCTFAVTSIPETWSNALRVGDVLVAPVGPQSRDQRLVRVERTHGGRLDAKDYGGVRYVPNRSRLS